MIEVWIFKISYKGTMTGSTPVLNSGEKFYDTAEKQIFHQIKKKLRWNKWSFSKTATEASPARFEGSMAVVLKDFDCMVMTSEYLAEDPIRFLSNNVLLH